MKKTLTLVCRHAGDCGVSHGAGRCEAEGRGQPATQTKGKETFEQCGACHNIDTDEKKMGPSLEGSLQERQSCNNGKKPTDANVKAIINKGGNGMPPYEELLSAEEKANVIAYLKTL